MDHGIHYSTCRHKFLFLPVSCLKQRLTGSFRITSYSALNFTIILNPDSGPGSSEYPGDDLVPQIQKLNAYTNVRTVGYVRTGYATRNITSVLLDVATYSSWAALSNTSGLAVKGIFFDEVPSEYSEASADYLATINQAAKNATGVLQDKTVGNIPLLSIFEVLHHSHSDISP